MTRYGTGIAWFALIGAPIAYAQDPQPVEDADSEAQPDEEADPWADLGSFSRPTPPASTTTRGPDRTMAVPNIDTPRMSSASSSSEEMFVPTVALDAITDREEFEQTLGANFASFAICYDQLPVENLSGHIELRWSVQKGKVIEAAVVENTTGNSPVGDCIIERIKGWSFPQNFEHELTYSLEFHTDR